MNEWLIPDYWLTGLGSWAISYFLHSTVILGSILLLCHFARFISQSNKDVLIKVGLVAGILTASIQFVQSSNGNFIKTVVLEIAPLYRQPPPQDTVRVVPQTNNEVVQQLLTVGPPVALPQQPTSDNRDNGFNRFWSDNIAPITALQWFLTVWAMGSLFLALRFIWLWWGFGRATGKRIPLTHQATVDLCLQLQSQMAIKRTLKLTQSNQIVSPMAVGWSEICIPEGLWSNIDEEQLTAIIAHELAHVVRMDSLWLFFWHLMSIVFFFQPLNKLTQLSFQSRAEFLADAIAVRQTKDPVAMVNSLISAAKLARLEASHRFAAHLLGANATIVERTKNLLDENPMKTHTSLSFIALSATVIVTLAALGLPSISLASKPVAKIDVTTQALPADNSMVWVLSPDNNLPFETSIDHHEAIAGLEVELHTKGITFTDDLDRIAKIAPNGQLRFVSRSIYESASLVIEADKAGQLNYRYLVDNEWITDQKAAEQFIQQLLDITMGRSDEFKRNRLEHLSNIPKRTETDAYQVTTMMLIRAMDNENGFYSAQDLKVITTMFKSPDFIENTDKKWTNEALENNSPFGIIVVDNGVNYAILNDFGHLYIKTQGPDDIMQSATYHLNNKAFYQLYLDATGQPYVYGETEKAMVRLLVQLHFNMAKETLVWLEV